MTKGQMIAHYRNMSTADQSTVDRWLKANMVIGTLIAGGVMLMALAGSNANLGPERAVAETAKSVSAARAPLSPFEIMSQLAPGALPIEQVDEPF
jgi:hypothetical protein